MLIEDEIAAARKDKTHSSFGFKSQKDNYCEREGLALGSMDCFSSFLSESSLGTIGKLLTARSCYKTLRSRTYSEEFSRAPNCVSIN